MDLKTATLYFGYPKNQKGGGKDNLSSAPFAKQIICILTSRAQLWRQFRSSCYYQQNSDTKPSAYPCRKFFLLRHKILSENQVIGLTLRPVFPKQGKT